MKSRFVITVKDRKTGTKFEINSPNLEVEIVKPITSVATENKLTFQTFKLSGIVSKIDRPRTKNKKKAKKNGK